MRHTYGSSPCPDLLQVGLHEVICNWPHKCLVTHPPLPPLLPGVGVLPLRAVKHRKLRVLPPLGCKTRMEQDQATGSKAGGQSQQGGVDITPWAVALAYGKCGMCPQLAGKAHQAPGHTHAWQPCVLQLPPWLLLPWRLPQLLHSEQPRWRPHCPTRCSAEHKDQEAKGFGTQFKLLKLETPIWKQYGHQLCCLLIPHLVPLGCCP
jgi:hypothetical protein